jgi:hypothetical protein
VTARLQGYVPDWVEPTLTQTPSARRCSGIAYDAAHDYTLLFGGGAAAQPNPDPQNDTWVLRNGWHQRSPAPSPSPRNGPGATYDATTGTVVLFGGTDPSGNNLNDTWTWDGVTWTQRFPTGSPSARSSTSLAYDASLGQVILFGGRNSYPGVGLTDTWGWNGSTWTQLKTQSHPGGRYSAAMDYDTVSGGLVLFGGWLECCTSDEDTWLLVPDPVP